MKFLVDLLVILLLTVACFFLIVVLITAIKVLVFDNIKATLARRRIAKYTAKTYEELKKEVTVNTPPKRGRKPKKQEEK